MPGDCEDLVGLDRAFGDLLALHDPVALRHAQGGAVDDLPLEPLAVVGGDDDEVAALLVLLERDDAVEVGDDRAVLRRTVQRRGYDRTAGSGGQRSRRTAGTAAGQGSKTNKN